jgi:hypothetical protein
MIFEQKKRFRDHVFDLTNNQTVWETTISRLELGSRNSKRLQDDILKLFSKKGQEYYTYVRNNDMELKETEISTIEAEFLTESISDMLFFIAQQKEASNTLKWQLGELLYRYMSTYNPKKNTQFAIPLIQTSKTTEKTHRDQAHLLYAKILVEYADSNERIWDPWFVCTLQGRLMELKSVLTADEHKQLLNIGKGIKKSKIASKWFKSVLAFVENLPEISSQSHLEALSSMKFTSINSWPDLGGRDVSEEEFTSFSEPILSNLPIKRKTLVDQVLILMLILSSSS